MTESVKSNPQHNAKIRGFTLHPIGMVPAGRFREVVEIGRDGTSMKRRMEVARAPMR